MYDVARRVAAQAETALRGRARARVVVPADREASATTRPRPRRKKLAARRLRDAYEGGVLPALRRCDGRDAQNARRSRRVSRSASRAGTNDGRHVGRDRPRRARLGRGVVRGHRLDPVRPDAGPRDVRRRVLVRVRAPTRRSRRFGGGSSRSRGRRALRAFPTRAICSRRRPREDERAPSLVGVGARCSRPCGSPSSASGRQLVRRARYLSRDPRRLATASRRELEGFLRDQGVDVPPNATLVTLQRAVHRELGLDGAPFAIAAARARFGPPATVAQGAATARKEVRRLIRSARRRALRCGRGSAASCRFGSLRFGERS